MRGREPSHTARGAAAYRAIHQTLEGGAISVIPSLQNPRRLTCAGLGDMCGLS